MKSARHTLRLAAIAFSALLSLVPNPLMAADSIKHRPFSEMKGGCENFQLNLKNEFSAWKKPAAKISAGSSSSEASAIPIGKRADLALVDQKKVHYSVRPEKTFSVSGPSFSGIAKITVPSSGKYRVSIGKKVWIDLVDQTSEKIVNASDFEMQTRCATLFKVVAYPLEENRTYFLQVSSSSENVVQVLVSPSL